MIELEAAGAVLPNVNVNASEESRTWTNSLHQEIIFSPTQYWTMHGGYVAAIVMVKEMFQRKCCHCRSVTCPQNGRVLAPWRRSIVSSHSMAVGTLNKTRQCRSLYGLIEVYCCETMLLLPLCARRLRAVSVWAVHTTCASSFLQPCSAAAAHLPLPPFACSLSCATSMRIVL